MAHDDEVAGAPRRPSCFADPALASSFETDGFAVVPLLDSATVSAVLDVLDDLGPAPGDPRIGFFPGINSTSGDWKRAVLERVRPLVDGPLAELLPGACIYFASFLAKWPDPDGEFPPHQDPTMVTDEHERPGITAWVPLHDLTADAARRGALRVLPGSHRLPTGDRSGVRRYNPEAFVGLDRAELERRSDLLAVRAGEAVLLDHRVVHWSGPNLDERPRWVLGVSMRPIGSGNVHVGIDGDLVEVHAVDDSFYLGPRTDEDARRHHELVRRSPRDPLPPLTPADLDALTPGATPAAVPAPTPRPTPAPPRTTLRRRIPSRRHHPVVADHAVERRLRRDGFATIRLLDASDALALRDSFGRLHGWEGEGFQVDFWHDDTGYRRAAAAAIASATDDALGRAFVGQQPFARNFVVKWPGEVSMTAFPQGPHRDWAYTDEADGVRSWTVWLALEDIDGDNGQLQVARGSHRLDRMTRGTNLKAAWLDHDDVWRPRLSTVPLRAGEAVILDAAVVHCSLANLTDRPRVAATMAVRPVGSALVHFRRRDDLMADRFEIDEDFFVTQTAEGLAAAPPSPVSDGSVPIATSTMTPRQLALRLDARPLALLHHARRLARRADAAPTPSSPTAPEAPAATVRLDDLPWAPTIEAAHATIRAELAAYLATTTLPLIETVTGVDQGNDGAWRTLVLHPLDRVDPAVAARFPGTLAALSTVPDVVTAGFSLLESGTHVPEHTGPDPVTRYHLGVIVPGAPGDARLRVGDTVHAWAEGESLVFSDTTPHEAWNDGADDRVVLVIDVPGTPR